MLTAPCQQWAVSWSQTVGELSCRHPDKPAPRWHLLRHRSVTAHFSQPCWSGLFIIVCSGVISWTRENCFTTPRCQEFLVAAQSDAGRALGVRLDAFLKAGAAKDGHSSWSWRGGSEALQHKLVVWFVSDLWVRRYQICHTSTSPGSGNQIQGCSQQNNLTLDLGSPVISPCGICRSRVIKSSGSQLCSPRPAKPGCLKRLMF